ncbi:DUF1330 domain-containing protein [Streptomyces sp. ZAF1911]|uniref:DUF1330 domain-containing protein n=1 Tax=unclassified Streptomyces TaxID=2593676 RepID=UPI00237ACE61|nr:DUF1330 domain-containing protein [Streptomyces sp. ZAF1911]MDD9379060.1 DUF1330 domain-containing protein [Streptomyces sp. ZAF1911]
MTAYAIGHIRPETMNEDILRYIEEIQSTMDPFEGRFLVHGRQVEVMEGTWPGTIVLIGFPDIERARGWYASQPYQALIPLRANHIAGDIILVDGVPTDYDASKTAATLREAAGL